MRELAFEKGRVLQDSTGESDCGVTHKCKQPGPGYLQVLGAAESRLQQVPRCMGQGQEAGTRLGRIRGDPAAAAGAVAEV